MNDPNPFAFVLQKPRRSLDREFYAGAKTFEDIDDAMWLYLLGLIPKRADSYSSAKTTMLKTLSPQLKTYFLVRQFSGEWGSGGMEGIFLADGDWRTWLPEAIAAFRSLRAARLAGLIEEVVAVADDASASRSEAELDRFSARFETFDREWSRLADIEDFFGVIYEDIQQDVTAYLHPPELK